MQSQNLSKIPCNSHLSHMLHFLRKRFRQIWSRLPWFLRRHPRPKLVVRRLRNLKNSKLRLTKKSKTNSTADKTTRVIRPIRLATFNAALFSLAPVIPKLNEPFICLQEDKDFPNAKNSPKPASPRPKGILKQSENQENRPTSIKSNKPKFVSINLPENEISKAQNVVMRSPICISASLFSGRTIFDVLKEVDVDVLALQDVKAVEEKGMSPLADLARALEMNYVFAESWAPEYGNAVLSRWPIKRWKVEKICDDKDFRNVIKATIDVPWTGELHVYCTQLDHLDESWRIKQIQTIIQSNDQPHLLVGGLNSLDSSDYSSERWSDIVKYYEEMGKPSPKVEVTNLLKGREYTDAKDFQGECEPVVMIAKGQNVQGTCKYGTRVDYILGSPRLNYKFVPGSYSVVSSKGTSDHHIVKVDIVKECDENRKSKRTHEKFSQSVARLTTSCSYIDTREINS